MLRQLCCLVTLLVLFGQAAFAQDGKISGTVKDENGEPVPFATVLVYDGELFVNGARTDDNGKYSVQPIEPGSYRVVVKYLTTDKTINNVPVNPGQTRFLDISFEEIKASQADEVVITDYKIPVFEKSAPSGQILGNDEVTNIGTRNTQSLAAITAGVYQSDEGNNSISIRGARSNATVYYIDGQKIRGGANLPQAAISTIQVITGGTSAEFGDFTGGVISITTAKPSSVTSGGFEVVTSEYLDDFGRNLGAVNLTGPIITKKEDYDGTIVKRPILGYFLAAEGEYNRDRRPTIDGIGNMTLREDILADFEQNPLQINASGRSFLSRANFVTLDDLEELEARPYLESRIKALGRLDFQPTENILVKFGGNVEFSDQDLWSTTRQVFALDGNGNFKSNTYRGWLRFQQQFKGGDNSLLKNFFYSIQGDFSRYERVFQNERHEQNPFDYGYVGKFTFDRVPFYQYVSDPLDPNGVSSSPYWQTAGYGFTNLQFDASDTRNPVLANYNSQIFQHVEETGILNPLRTIVSPDLVLNNLQNLNNLAFVQGILNGRAPGSIYGLYSGLGNDYGFFAKFSFDQYRLNANATAEIKNHNIKAGFEFEQRVERFYQVNARPLWGWMRLYTNTHFANNLEEDPANFQYVYRDGIFQDTVNVPNLYNASEQTTFDRNVRAKLGLDPTGTDFINIDELGPDFFSLDMFSADELLADGLGPLTYYGYDYLGNPNERGDPAQFFTDTDNRPQNPYAPTYISGFIQDKFEFEDIIFNLGLRVDRFDANQPVLRDNYSLHPIFEAAETASQLGISLPNGVGNDWTAYVDNATNPSAIIGYREGDTWYDADGAPTASTTIATSSGGKPKPHIKEESVNIESFQDYEPQTVFMPRVSFSFPISDVALFFAHYDVLSQRPGQLLAFQSSRLAGQLSDYAFLENRPTIDVENPSLKPEITVDYEVGFRQKIGQRMALSVQGFYREMRNMIRFRRFVNAWPFTYETFDNLDYGTVKGLTLSFDMRRTGNVQLRASYTLQYADETGATAGAARNISTQLEGTSVLRVQVPSGIDQRHRIVGVFDYRYAGSRTGPGFKIGKKMFYPFKNAGTNLTLTLGSGTPYSQSQFAVPSVQTGTPINQIQEGSPNGARRPTQFRADLRIDKAFTFGGKKKENGIVSREYSFNIYLLMLNALNSNNVLSVYRFTGLPDDDGYLASDVGQQAIQTQISPESFVDLYQTRVANPFNFARPRTIRLGLMFNF